MEDRTRALFRTRPAAVVTSRMHFDGLELTIDVVELSDVDPSLAGIYSPRFSDDAVARYVHGQFLKDADSYLERYQSTPYWRSLLERAQGHYRLASHGGTMRILDLGSGGGNTVLPLLELYPDAEVVASDLSLPLLKALRSTLEERYPTRRVPVFQQNAEQLLFADGQFDLVVVGAILHHLRAPWRAIAESGRVLRPGGVALFFEPFRAGNQIIAAGFQAMLELNRGRSPRAARALPEEVRSFIGGLPLPDSDAPRLSPRLATALRGFCEDIAGRARMNWLAARIRNLDDKWLFDRAFFSRAARRSGFREPMIYSMADGPKRVASHMRGLMRLMLGSDDCALPPWGAAILEGIDGCVGERSTDEMIIEATIVLELKQCL